MFLEKVRTDVLCIGGGIASLMAAIRAGELGVKVVVADKANTLYSGSGGLGNDHFLSYIPEIHGNDINAVIQTIRQTLAAAMRNAGYMRRWLENTFETIKLWDSWGIPMKYEGRYEFAGHVIPGKPRLFLHYNGQGQKKVLTREALKRGVKIINRVMVFDLISNGSVLGALGIDTRDEKMILFEAKSVVIATGRCVRLYPAPLPGWMFNVAYSPGCTGDGMAMAYRAGAGLGNLEMTGRWAGPRYLARCGKASWVGVIRDPQDKPIGPFVTRPDRRYGDPISDIYPGLFNDYAKSARGPVYMDCKGISDDDYQYMLHFMKHEGLTSLLNHAAEEGIDLRKHPIEFGTYEFIPRGGIHHNDQGETSVNGLFAAGDEAYSNSGISMASTWGWLIGERMAQQVKETNPPNADDMNALIEERRNRVQEMLRRKDGPDWKEVNVALQQIMQDYAGDKRTENLLQAGRRYLHRLKEKAHHTMMARNQHELVRCLEVLNLIDVGELLMFAANERKETRAAHKRPDYPFTNPVLERFLVIRDKEGRPSAEWVDIKH
jgi:succinate dehydrogenase/fumarate reductase flavoprotein subunit